MLYFIMVIIWGLIWGFATKTVNENKGYDGGFWLGFLLGFIGLIIVACKPENRAVTDYATSSLLSAAAQENDEKRMLSSGGWKCSKCGRVNPSYTGSCGCGMSKSDNEAKKQAAIEEAKAKEKSQQELDNLKKVKEYKDLLDSGVISEEEFEKKKKELLNL